jgi:hypothetical protein
MRHCAYMLICVASILIGCRSKGCYEINVRVDKRAHIEKNFFLVTDDGIIAATTDVDTGADDWDVAKICILNKGQFPTNAKFFAGYAKEFYSSCIKVEFDSVPELHNGTSSFVSSYRDTLKFKFPANDTTLSNNLTKKIIDVVKEYSKRENK